jgi:hypothetical protein
MISILDLLRTLLEHSQRFVGPEAVYFTHILRYFFFFLIALFVNLAFKRP